ncbi:MAG TPA: hypothetical protein VHT52_01730 [Stellaceae bacterium]|nr:hypothetical protein [Stellaceae bacterium]
MGDLGSLFGGGSSSSSGASSGGNPLSSVGDTLSSLFTGVGNAFSGAGAAVNPVSSANAADSAAVQAFDPTGSIGAQETISPPSAGSPSDQQSSVGGTQSGGAPQQNQQQTQQNQQYAPPEAVDSLKKALQALAQGQGQQNPYQLPAAQNAQGLRQAMPAPQAPLPTLQPGETGVADDPNLAAAVPRIALDRSGGIPAGLPTGAPAASPISPTDPAEASIPPDGGPTGDGTVATNAEGQPVTAAGTPASQTPQPPGRPTPTGPSTTGGKPTPQTDDQGRAITVKAKPQPGDDADLPTKVPLPTKKPGVLPTKKGGLIPAPDFPPEPGPIMRDVTGGQGVPPALAQLAQGALGMLLPMLLSGGFGGGGRRGGRGFHPFRHFGGVHHGGEGHWPYHHPMRGWQMHDHHPGGGWQPIHPHHMRDLAQGGNDQASQMMQAIFGNSQQGQANQQQAGGDPGGGNQAPADTTQYDASKVPDGSTERGTPGVSATQYDQFARSYAQQIGLDPDVVSRVLATESSFGQNIYGDYENGRPTSFGGFQLHLSPDGKAMGNQYMRDTGHAPWDHKYWQEQVKYALDHMKKGGLGPWKTTMNKLGYGVWSANGSPTRQATAPTPATTPAPQALAPDAVDAGAG